MSKLLSSRLCLSSLILLSLFFFFFQKGNLDEINRHFSNFHSYRPPVYTEDLWDQVSADNLYLSTLDACTVPCSSVDGDRDALIVPCDLSPLAGRCPVATNANQTPYLHSSLPYSPPLSQSFAPVTSTWLRPEIVPLPGTDYSMMGHPSILAAVPPPPAEAAAVPSSHLPHDFYTCVQLMNDTGEVHLVPCLPPAYCKELVPPPVYEKEEKKKKQQQQMSEFKNNQRKSGAEAELSEVSAPLLPDDLN